MAINELRNAIACVAQALGLCVAVLLIGSCSRAPNSAATATTGAVLRIAQTREPASLDPLVLDGSTAEEIGVLVFSHLLSVDDRGNIVPDVAEAVPTIENGGISRDGKRITYRLRRGARWHDGSPLTSKDVLYTYRAVMNPQSNVTTRLGFDQIASLTAPDPYTVVVRLRHPFAPFLTYFIETENYPILPAHVPPASSSSAVVGSGPYRVSEWIHGDHITLVANDLYWLGKPAVPKVILRFVPDAQTITTLLQTGEADVTFDLDVSIRRDLSRRLAHHDVQTRPTYGFGALLFNTRAAPFSDRAVRAAFARGIDVETIVRKASRGALTSHDAPRGLFTWAYDPTIPPNAFDRGAADRLLRSRGWMPGPDGVRRNGTHRFETTLAFDTSSPLMRVVAVGLQQQAADLGMTMHLKAYTPTQFHALDARGPLASGRFGVALDTLLTGFDPEPSWLLGCNQAPPSGSNYMRFCDRETDASENDALGTFERSRRVTDYRKVQQRLSALMPLIFLWRSEQITVVPKTLRGAAGSPETPYWASWRWTF